ncbi:MAG TPA: rod shape-determining protein MreC [Burkholderiales bacterium]|nr:rod shape-determining protein MreC [Burkholderiales bacterium]
MELQPPPLFARGPAPLVRLTFFVSLAALLMVLDARFHYAETLRTVLAIVAYPLQRAAMAPVDAAQGIANYFESQTSLRRENDALQGKVLQAAKDTLTLESLRAENNQMRRLLEARDKLPVHVVFAEILYSGRDPFSRKVIIDRGTMQLVKAGQPVIDENGVIGQVTRAFPMLAEVTLVTDKEQATPVQVVRNGLRGVLYGDGAALDLRFMAANADIQNGDLLVTSGIDGTYPQGLPVARVAKVERDAAYAFARIQCVPAAGENQHRQVLVLAQDTDLPPAPASEPPAQAKSGKSKRGAKRATPSEGR